MGNGNTKSFPCKQFPLDNVVACILSSLENFPFLKIKRFKFVCLRSLFFYKYEKPCLKVLTFCFTHETRFVSVAIFRQVQKVLYKTGEDTNSWRQRNVKNRLMKGQSWPRDLPSHVELM